MSQRAPDAFVPFDPAPAVVAPDGPSGTKPPLKVVPKAQAGPVFAPFEGSAAAHAHSPQGAGGGKPVVTLEREGERVTAIRIECACGQVIELACSY